MKYYIAYGSNLNTERQENLLWEKSRITGLSLEEKKNQP